jgi:CheY-like chemotaxis protein
MASIMVVDDNDSVRLFIARVLEREGHAVITCEDAECALTQFDRRSIDLIVTDLFMQGMDGLELVRELRQRRPDVRILAMSGDLSPTRPSVLKAAGACGAIKTLEKPFTIAQLLAEVTAGLEP